MKNKLSNPFRLGALFLGMVALFLGNSLQAQCGALTINDISISYSTAGNNTQNVLLTWPDVGAAAYKLIALRKDGGGSVSTTVTGTSLSIPGVPSCTEFRYSIETLCPDGSVGYSSNGHSSTGGCSISPADIVVNATSFQASWPDLTGGPYFARVTDFNEDEYGWLLLGPDVQLPSPCPTGSGGGGSGSGSGSDPQPPYSIQILNPITGEPLSQRTAVTMDCQSSGGGNVLHCKAVNIGSAGADVDGTTVDLSWNDSGANSYFVQFRKSGFTAWASAGANGTSATLSNLAPCTSYDFRVIAECSDGDKYSSISGFTTKNSHGSSCGGGGTECISPSNLSALTGANVISVRWEDTGADEYVVTIWKSDASWADEGSTMGTSYTFGGLESCTVYRFEVMPICDGTTGPAGSLGAASTLCGGGSSGKLAGSGFGLNGGLHMAVGPQPANNLVKVELELSNASDLVLELYDLQGRKMGVLVNEASIEAGKHVFEVPLAQLGSGVYSLRARAGSASLVQKLVVQK